MSIPDFTLPQEVIDEVFDGNLFAEEQVTETAPPAEAEQHEQTYTDNVAVQEQSQEQAPAETQAATDNLPSQAEMAARLAQIELQETQRKLAELERHNAELAARIQQSEQQKQAETQNDWLDDLVKGEFTEEEMKVYGASKPFIEKVAAHVLKRFDEARVAPLATTVQQGFNTLNSQFGQVQEISESQHLKNTVAEIQRALPWFTNETVQSPEYQRFIKGTVRGGFKRDVLVRVALDAGNTAGVVDLLSEFQPKTDDKLAAQVTGGTSKITPDTVRAKPKDGTMHINELRQAGQDFRDGKISDAKYREVTDKWNLALVNGTAVTD